MRLLKTAIPTVAALAGALLALVVLTPGPASARGGCQPRARVRSAPRLTTPCDAAIVRAHRSITFTAVDDSGQAPYLNLQTSHLLRDGHLRVDQDGNGIFAQMSAVTGRRGVWTYTATRQSYPSWWDNRPGTDYVQLEQADPRVASGIVYGPITTVRVR